MRKVLINLILTLMAIALILIYRDNSFSRLSGEEFALLKEKVNEYTEKEDTDAYKRYEAVEFADKQD